MLFIGGKKISTMLIKREREPFGFEKMNKACHPAKSITTANVYLNLNSKSHIVFVR